MSSKPSQKTSTAARAAAWVMVALLGTVVASVCVLVIVWIWSGILDIVG